MKRILTGIKPTNELHIGNYCGSMVNIKNSSDSDEMLVFVADLHALTNNNAPRNQSIKMLKSYLAILPHNHLYYIQSDFPQVCEMSWYLSCICSAGKLHRMTQFKSQIKDVNSGYLFYPILMSADIMTTRADLIAVGEDQIQHIELARNIIRSFNQKYKLNFTEPKALLSQGARIKNLQDHSKKMSKSDDSEIGTIFLNDNADAICRKISRAQTDNLLMPENIMEIKISRPQIYNLCQVFSVFSGKDFSNVESNYKGQYISTFKRDLQQCLIEKLIPIQEFCQSISDEEVEVFLKSKREKVERTFNSSLNLVRNSLYNIL